MPEKFIRTISSRFWLFYWLETIQPILDQYVMKFDAVQEQEFLASFLSDEVK